jgi:hypothetical protein
MKITITILRIGHDEPENFIVEPEDYFDPIEPGESYWDCGVESILPKEDGLPVDKSKVKWFIITESNGDRVRRFRYQLLGESQSIHVKDEFGNEEIITQSKVSTDTRHTVRSMKPFDGEWTTYMDNVSFENEDHHHSENLITSWDFKEAKAFSYIKPIKPLTKA